MTAKAKEAPGQKAARQHRPGELIDPKYRLVRRLGQGGFGEVWVAENLVLEVHVAVKLLYDDASGGATGERLLQEARAAAMLGHPAIVRVFEFGRTTAREPFIAMELLHGETLADVIVNRGRLSAAVALQTLLPIADALAVAHSKGIIHRDVKPENIFLSRDELGRLSPKLLDFGIARVRVDQNLTARGAVLGTPSYMSPEQARGSAEVDLRTDVWGFTVVLYELLTGRPPFEKDNYNALLQSIIHDDPLPTMEHRAGDAELWRLLETGLAKDPDKRWESMRMMGEALALWLYERGIHEDICASSLKTAWLEAEFSDVKIVVSSPPPASSPRLSAETVAQPSAPPARRAPAAPPAEERVAAKQAPLRGDRTKIVGVAAAVALVILAALLLMLRRAPAPEAAGIEPIAAAPGPSPASAKEAVASPEPTVAPTTEAPAPIAAPESSALAKKRPRALVPAATAAPTAPPAAAKPAPPASKPGQKIDLGF